MRYLSPLLLTLSLLLLSACGEPEKLAIQVGQAKAKVELATNQEQRKQGLMKRHQLGSDVGMLFVYPSPNKIAIWMKDVPIPLDVGFFDQNGVLLNIHNMVPDGGKRIYYANGLALYALEMNQGWFEQRGVSTGAKLILPKTIKGK